MFSPFLLVGLGGSGGKTLRTVRDELSRRLAQSGWTDDFPTAWQFVHVDVPTVPDGDDADLPPQLPPTSYRGLVKPGLTYKTLDDALWQKADKSQPAKDALAGWRPRALEVNVPVDKGAGQYRALGRFITVGSLSAVREAVQQGFTRLQEPRVPGELARLSTLFGDSPSTAVPQPVVIIVASIAGGSGAGMIMDVSDVVRSVGGPAGDHSIGMLYAPDVFDDIPAEQRKGVRPNALASLGEILNGYWATEGLGDGDAALYELSGVPAAAAKRSGPHYPILVGRKNSRVSFGNQNDVYRAMGRALSSWMTDAVIQDSFRAYAIANWANNAEQVPDNLPLKLVSQATPFSAIGFARVGLGRDLFRQYSGEALARAAVERLLHRHEELRQPNDDRPETALVSDLADSEFPRFIKACQLDERTEEANDILDALTPDDFAERMRAASTGALVSVTQGLEAATWDTWGTRIRQALDARVKVTADGLKNETLQLARSWVSEVQQRLADEVAVSIARNGIPTTLALLDRLTEELRAVLVELPAEAERYQRWAQSALTEAMAVGADKGKSEIPNKHPDLRESIDRGLREAEHLAQVQTRQVAVALIKDSLTHLIAPLKSALSGELHTLRDAAVATVDGRPAVVQTWPMETEVPKRLRPSLNDVLLTSSDAYPVLLGDLIRRTTGAGDAGAARREAVAQLVTGAFDDQPQSLVVTTARWTPSDSALHASASDAETRATFAINVAAGAVLGRADEWVSRPGTAVGDFVHENLADYLSADGEEAQVRSRRLQDFESGLAAAVDLAEPLVNINAGVMSVVHGRPEYSATRIFSGIPFPQGHPARERAVRVLHTKGMLDDEIARVFVDDDKQFVDIFTTLSEPYEPVVFDSLMKPIAEEWSMRNKTADGRAQFWRWRRSRPLPQALPMAAAVRRSMCRGWFTAQVLGQLRATGDSWEIFVPSGGSAPGTWAAFPSPLLMVQATQAHESLPAVLKSVLIAMLDVNASGTVDAIRPYGRLRELGASGKGLGMEVYQRATPELEAWILTGGLPAGAPEPNAHNAGIRSGTPEERARAIADRWATQEASYRNLFEETDSRTNFFDVPGAWELRADIEAAFEDLRAAASSTPRFGLESDNY